MASAWLCNSSAASRAHGQRNSLVLIAAIGSRTFYEQFENRRSVDFLGEPHRFQFRWDARRDSFLITTPHIARATMNAFRLEIVQLKSIRVSHLTRAAFFGALAALHVGEFMGCTSLNCPAGSALVDGSCKMIASDELSADSRYGLRRDRIGISRGDTLLRRRRK